MTEVVRNGRRQVLGLLKDFVPVVLDCICSDNSDVQAAAAELFTALNKAVGARVLDEVLPSLIDDVIKGSPRARAGLHQLLRARGTVILAYFIPRLVDSELIGSGQVKLSFLYISIISLILTTVYSVVPSIGCHC